jgi:3-deoxy-D-manno-octulosonic-acid transferase
MHFYLSWSITSIETNKMLLAYNLIQIVLFPVLLLPAIVYIMLKAKYRKRILFRLGFGLSSKLTAIDTHQKTFWIHALSVGEVTSAIPLVTGIRHRWPEAVIVVSTATKSGHEVAASLLQDSHVILVDGPLDLLPVVSYFVTKIRPDFFLLVETDFWPNLIGFLRQKHIPVILVNGRISRRSMQRYHTFRFFFQPLFNSFDQLCLQTETDRSNLARLGVPKEKLHTLGNLKFDGAAARPRVIRRDLQALLPGKGPTIIAGSTHRGEEEMLLHCFQKLRDTHTHLQLILAPRDPKRAAEIVALCRQLHLQAILRSDERPQSGDLLLLDTLGELNTFYALADIAFVGGSLVAAGGHNPIEPASYGIPVLFGPHMEDFEEISAGLMTHGGGIEVLDKSTLAFELNRLLSHPEQRDTIGQAAKNTISMVQGVVEAHLELLQRL